jgi:hypothetical protein
MEIELRKPFLRNIYEFNGKIYAVKNARVVLLQNCSDIVSRAASQIKDVRSSGDMLALKLTHPVLVCCVIIKFFCIIMSAFVVCGNCLPRIRCVHCFPVRQRCFSDPKMY